MVHYVVIIVQSFINVMRKVWILRNPWIVLRKVAIHALHKNPWIAHKLRKPWISVEACGSAEFHLASNNHMHVD